MRLVFSKKFREFNDRFGWALSIIALPSLLSDLAWWSALFQYILTVVPQWLLSALILIRDLIKPALDAYEYIVVFIFSVFPFEVPKWLSISLPPILSLFFASLISMSIYRRASIARRYLSMIEDPRFHNTSVIRGLISNGSIKLPMNDIYDLHGLKTEELIEVVKPQVIKLENNMKIRVFALNGLIFIYVSILIVEFFYRMNFLFI